MKKLIILFVFFVSPVVAQPQNITLYYSMTFGGIEIGEITDRLHFNEGEFEIISTSESLGLAKILGQSGVNRISRGTYDEDGNLQTYYFESERKEQVRKSEVNYETNNVLITSEDDNTEEKEFTYEKLHDSLSLIYEYYTSNGYDDQNSFQVTDGKRVSIYNFAPDEETSKMQTEFGEIDVLRFERTNAREGRKYQVWFAPNHSFLPVRISLRRESNHIEFILTKIDY